jgi:DNA-binding CsgD family transcriptional regulator
MSRVLGTLLLDLYQGSRKIDVGRFQHWALEQVKSVLPFDSALWAHGMLNGSEIVIHNAHLYNLPREMFREYGQLRGEDPILLEIYRNKGTTINLNLAQLRPRAKPDSHHKRYNINYVLSTMTVDPVTRSLSAISLYRSDTRQPFNELERVLKQNLMPHLVGIFADKKLQQVLHFANNHERLNYVSALADHTGLLQFAEREFVELLRSEWLQWKALKLPEELVSCANSKSPQPYIGNSIVVKFIPMGSAVGLKARIKESYDSLGRRERQVAELYAEGQTYKQVAKTLKIAPSTVSNELHSVYIKLNIASKPQLMQLINSLK